MCILLIYIVSRTDHCVRKSCHCSLNKPRTVEFTILWPTLFDPFVVFSLLLRGFRSGEFPFRFSSQKFVAKFVTRWFLMVRTS